MSPQAAARMMTIAGVIFFAVSLVIAFGAYPPTNGPSVLLFDLVDWPLDGGANLVATETRLLGAVLGGVFAGFSMMLILIVAPAIRNGDESVCRAAIISMLTWFVIDSVGSVAAGVAANAIFNLAFLALMMAPLLLVKRSAA